MGLYRFEVDDRLLEQASRVLGTRRIEQTIRVALEEVVRGDARRQEVEALAAMEGMDLDDSKVMSGAWRE